MQDLKIPSAKDQPADITVNLQSLQSNQPGDEMEKRGLPIDTAMGFADLEAALLELRDALICFSLALQDWQFDNDLAQRRLAGRATDSLLRQISGTPGPVN